MCNPISIFLSFVTVIKSCTMVISLKGQKHHGLVNLKTNGDQNNDLLLSSYVFMLLVCPLGSVSTANIDALLVGVFQRNQTNRIWKQVYYEELTHPAMEVEKSHHLPSASWRLRKISGVIQFKDEGLRNREADVNLSWRARKRWWEPPL